MANLKFNYDKDEYDLYNEELKNYTPYNKYVKDMPKHRQSSIKTELLQFCICHHTGIAELMSDKENAKERVKTFETFLFDNGYALGTVESRKATVKSFYRFNGIDVPKPYRTFDKNLREEIRNSESFNYFLSIKTRTEKTNNRYLSDLTDYCYFNDMSIDDLIAEAHKEEDDNIKKNRRKLKTRLVNFRAYLRNQGFSEKHIKTRFRNVKSFYKMNDVEIPFIPEDTKQYDRQLRYDEIPTKEDIKRAIETTTSLRNRAMYLFMATSGSGSAETRTFTVREWMLGTKEFHGETEDIERALNKMDGEMEYIPVFPIVRQKKNLDYYTCITPEANQYIVNYLKTRKNLTLDDYVFDISENSLGDAYRSVNDKLGWGRVKGGKFRFFSSHQMRRFNFNVFGIENESFAYMIQGRKFSATSESYYVRNPEKIRPKYRKFVNDLTIFQKYEIKDLNSKEYLDMQKKIQEKDDEMAALKEQHREEIKQLKNQMKEKDDEYKTSQENIMNRLNDLENQLPHLANTNPTMVQVTNEPVSFELMIAIHGLIDYHKSNEENPQWLDIKIKSLKYREQKALADITYDLIMQEEKIPETQMELDPLLIKALFKMEENPQLVNEIIRHYNARSMNIQKAMKYTDLLYDLMAEHVVTDKERAEWEAHKKFEKENNVKKMFNSDSKMAKVADAIAKKFYSTIDDYLLEEITEDFVMEDIVEFFQSNVDE